MRRLFSSVMFYLLLFVVIISFWQMVSEQRNDEVVLRYDEFLELLAADEVEELSAVLEASGNDVEGTLKDGTRFVATLPDDPSLYAMIREKNVETSFSLPASPPWWSALLSTMLPMLLVIAAFFFIMQQTQGGGNRVMQFGKSRARLHVPSDGKKYTFKDVAGIDEVIEELTEIVDYLKHPRRYMELGAKIPKGVLLFGAPGTGKTLVARAVAGEAGVPFFSISGSDFVEMFVGVGAARVRDLFGDAKKSAPCIVFVDEIDAVGRQRGAGYGGGHDEREQTLNQLLVEMDGFGVNEGIIVIAATNRPDVLDPALLRPGRFDRQIVIDRPDLNGRAEILRVHSRGKPLADNVDLDLIAKRTPGFTGADIANMFNEAALLAARRRKERVTMEELEEAVERVVGGPEKKSRVISDREKKIVAFHEAAHTMVAHLLPHADPVHKVSIIPRGGALGYILQLPIEDRYLTTKSELIDRVTVLLAGRAAEKMIFSEVSTGAHDDLEKATKLVRRMATEFGMIDDLGALTFGTKQDSPFLGRDIARDRDYSEEVAAAIDREIKSVTGQCYERAVKLLETNRDQLEALAKALIERETLEGDELEELLEQAQQEQAS